MEATPAAWCATAILSSGKDDTLVPTEAICDKVRPAETRGALSAALCSILSDILLASVQCICLSGNVCDGWHYSYNNQLLLTNWHMWQRKAQS